MLTGKATNTNCIVFGLTQTGLEPTIYYTWGVHANHYTMDAINKFKKTYKIFVMVPNLYWSILTSTCTPSSIVTIATSCWYCFSSLLCFRLHNIFVFFTFCACIPKPYRSVISYKGLNMYNFTEKTLLFIIYT